MEELRGDLPGQSTQYQQGNDTTSRQRAHLGIGSFSASKSEIVFRIVSRQRLACLSVNGMSLLKRVQ